MPEAFPVRSHHWQRIFVLKFDWFNVG